MQIIEKVKNFITIRSVIFLALALVLTIAAAKEYYCWSTPLRFNVPQEDDLLDTLYVSKDMVTNNLIAKDDGTLELDGEDCYFELTDLKTTGRTIVLWFKKPYKDEAPSYSVTLDRGEGYYDEDPEKVVYVSANILADCVCIPLPDADYTAVRIRPNMSMELSKIEIHEKEPVTVFKNNEYSGRRFVKGILVGFLAWIVIAVAEFYFGISKAFLEFVKKNKWILLSDAIAIAVSIGIAHLCNQHFGNGEYSFAYNVFISTAILAGFVLIRNAFLKKVPAEQTFFALLLLTGVCMTFCCWPNVSWDAMMHYESTLQATEAGSRLGVTDGNAAFLAEVGTDDTYANTVEAINNREEGVSFWLDNGFNAVRLPAAFFMILGNIFGVGAFTNYFIGRLAQLFVYSLCGYFAMKRLHSGKMIFAVIYLMPVNLFLASNFSYDYVVTAFLMLGMAYFVGMCQEKEVDVEIKDVIVMLAAMFYGCMAKQIYMPIFFFTFFMSREKLKKHKKLYYFLCAAVTVAALIAFAIASLGNVNGEQDMRAGLGEVNGKEQFYFIIHNVWWYYVHLKEYMLMWYNPKFNATGTFLAYLGNGVGYTVTLVLLALVTLFDKQTEYDKQTYPILARIYSVLFFIGEGALIVTALYMAFSPVGSDYMAGAQPRYYIPTVYPLCALLCGRGISVEKFLPKKVSHTIIMGIMVYIAFLNVYTLMLPMTLY